MRVSWKIRIIVIAIAILSIGCILCYAIVAAYPDIAGGGIRSTAQRLGVEPNLGAIAKYVEGKVEIGMSRREVEQILREVAPIIQIEPRTTEYVADPRVQSSYLITLRFQRPPLPGQMLVIVAHYDANDRLVAMADLGGEHFRIDGD